MGAEQAVLVSSVNPVIAVGVALILAVVVAVAMWALATIFGPKRTTDNKLMPFECGNPSEGVAGRRFSIKFYLVAVLFLVFDLEAAFVYPWAVLFRKLGWFGALEMLLFIGMLVAALAYVWKKGALKWEE